MAPSRLPTEVLTDRYNRFAVDLASRLAAHDMIWADPHGPSANWMDGAPIGNGDFGALVYGYPDNLTLALGKTDLWVRAADRSGFPEGTFDDVRAIYDAQDEARFEAVRQTPSPHPYGRTSHLTTAGLLRLHLADACIQAACTLRVSLYEATATYAFHTWRLHAGQPRIDIPLRVTTFCSRPDDVLVVHIAADHAAPGPLSAILSRQPHPMLPPAQPTVDGDVMQVHQELLKGDAYVLAARLLGQPARLQLVPRGVWAECEGAGPDPIVLLLTLVSRQDHPDPAAEARRRLAAAAQKGFASLLDAHRAWWRDFWKRSYVAIADAAAEKWWYVSNYLAGSMLRPGKLSPGLQGVWIKENMPCWNADFHGNINIQSNYWGLLAGNRLDLMEPYFRLYTGMLPQCRRDTAAYFRMRGVRLPHAADPDGHELTDNTWFVLGTHVAISGWIAQLFWQYYEYTLDEDFLRQTAYPLLSDVALFYADFLRWDAAAGCYVVEPSVSFEAFCPTLKAMGRNSTYDLAIIRLTFQMALAAAAIVGDTSDRPALWRQRLERLAPLPLTPDGAWAGWEGRGPISAGHGQTVPFLTPIFPCGLASAFHGSPELRRQAAASWLDFLRRAGGGRATCEMATGYSWCGGSPVATAAAMADADFALAGARWPDKGTLLRNGLVGSWQTPYLQADHGPGMALALNSMMLQCFDGTLYVFPAVPPTLDAAFHSLRAPGAFLLSAEQRGGQVAYVILQSLAGRPARLASPFDPAPTRERPVFTLPVRVRDLQSGKVLAAASLGRWEPIAWPTRPGGVYVVERTDRPLETWPTGDGKKPPSA